MRNDPAPDSCHSSSPFCRVAREAMDWVWFSAAVGILFNAFAPSGIGLNPSARKDAPASPVTAAAPASYDGWNNTEKTKPRRSPRVQLSPAAAKTGLAYTSISLVGARKIFEDQSALFLDARKAKEYSAGHIPRAINYYAEEFDALAPKVLPNLDPSKTYVIYCTGSECDLSHDLAKRLGEQGFKHLKVFFGGWPEWKKAGLPVSTGSAP